jgi:hypothetical protein
VLHRLQIAERVFAFFRSEIDIRGVILVGFIFLEGESLQLHIIEKAAICSAVDLGVEAHLSRFLVKF